MFKGDVRGAFYPTLTLWHSIFVRFHNLIASGLTNRNAHWNDERIFQETRRILTAVYQNIVFNEWLPPYVGWDVATRRNVSRPNNADDSYGYDFYDDQLDASNMNEFGVGAFRLFHANTPVNINMYDASMDETARANQRTEINLYGFCLKITLWTKYCHWTTQCMDRIYWNVSTME